MRKMTVRTVTTIQLVLLWIRTSLAAHKKSPYLNSTCDEDEGEWNRQDVGRKIKEWILSIKVDPDYMPRDKAIAFFDEANERIEFIGNVDHEGYAVGNFWLSPDHSSTSPFVNGFFYGEMDSEGKMSGEKAAFLFPDMRTAMVGRFSSGSMEEARPTVVSAERCRGGIKVLKFRRPRPSAPSLGFKPASHLRFGGPGNIPDPYEQKTVYIRSGGATGEGLFAKRDISSGEHIAYYAGMTFDEASHPFFHDNQTEEEMFIVHKYLIVLEGSIHLNLPHEYWGLDKYRATLAHKVNHSFRRTNCAFNNAFHPRYGKIRGVEATKNISKGEEILVHYGYSMDTLLPRWYYEAYKEEVGELTGDAKTTYERRFGGGGDSQNGSSAE